MKVRGCWEPGTVRGSMGCSACLSKLKQAISSSVSLNNRRYLRILSLACVVEVEKEHNVEEQIVMGMVFAGSCGGLPLKKE
ncbi:unnamed protein product [Arctogadus glacialis]